MLKLLQNLKNGEISLVESTCPIQGEGEYLIKTTKSLISTGTEKMLLEFGKANYIDKARQQPDKVRMVIKKIISEGIFSTIESVRSRLNEPLHMGYCNVGTVEESFDGGFKKGTRVISNGNHASFVTVKKHLVAKIPDQVDDNTAAFVIPGSIALQGIRLLKPELGETIVVYGLGLLGQLAVQILVANGCEVIGIDLNEERCKLAEEFGAKTFNTADSLEELNKFKEDFNIDGVLITASSKSDEILKSSANILRKRGRIVLVGVVGLNIDRSDFYEKEISFQVSCSYGPGRYDYNYEEKNLDYPIEFVRWTENRNFQAVLQLMSEKKINITKLISKVEKIENATAAYKTILEQNPLAVLLEYSDIKQTRTVTLRQKKPSTKSTKISFIGAGNYASRTLMPAFNSAGFEFVSLMTKGGISGKQFGDEFKFEKITNNLDEILKDDSDLVVIATRHNMHAEQCIACLNADKDVFVEKPLALNIGELNDIENKIKTSNKRLMVGFNRRFSPQITKIKNYLDKLNSSKSFIYTINAGYIDGEHWTHDKSVGGGRIIGEACHFLDLIKYLSGGNISSINSMYLDPNTSAKKDVAIITAEFSDGSIGSINYFSNSSEVLPKERLEIYCDGKVIELDNFKNMKTFNCNGLNDNKLLKIDKGQNNMVKSLKKALEDGDPSPIPQEDILEISRKILEIN